MLELNLNFPNPQQVRVSLINENRREETDWLEFSAPLSENYFREISWYLEDYAVQHNNPVDDETALLVVDQLPKWGMALFDKVFADKRALNLFKAFQENEQQGRLLTITADHSDILSLPWELLHDSKKGHFLIQEYPHISIRRRIQGLTRKTFQVEPKSQLHLLLVVSRPKDAIHSDTEASTVLNALKSCVPERVTVEFLWPATLTALCDRLEDEDLSPVDMILFDGHGIFDREGHLAEKVNSDFKTLSDDLKKVAVAEADKNTGYLLFEKESGETHWVPTKLLANILNKQQIALVILSACQSATAGSGEEDIGSVAAHLTASGIPAVLAINYSVLMSAMQKLFDAFYHNLARGRKIGVALAHARMALYQDTERVAHRRSELGSQPIKIQLHDWFLPTLYQQPGPDIALLTKEVSLIPEDDAISSVIEERLIGEYSKDTPLQEIAQIMGNHLKEQDLWEQLGANWEHLNGQQMSSPSEEQNELMEEMSGEKHPEFVEQFRLGTLAMLQGDLNGAERYYRESLAMAQQLKDPKSEAISWHQLGMIYRKTQQWEAAEQAYLQSAHIMEEQRNLVGSASIWNNLALVCINLGKLSEAEKWYHKAIESGKVAEDWVSVSKYLNNFADLLQNQPERLDETQQLAEESLAMMKTLDKSVAHIWAPYTTLAEVAEKQNNLSQAKNYRHLAREAKVRFNGTLYELQQYQELIEAVVNATKQPPGSKLLNFLKPKKSEHLTKLESEWLQEMDQLGLEQLVAAIYRLIDGERDWHSLCETDGLNLKAAMIVWAVLQRL